MTINDLKYLNINSVNPLYPIFIKVNRYFKVINKRTYLKLVSTNESKEKVKNAKNCGVKSEISLDKKLKTQMLMIKSIYEN